MNCCDVDDVVSKKLQVGQLADPELKKKEKKKTEKERDDERKLWGIHKMTSTRDDQN